VLIGEDDKSRERIPRSDDPLDDPLDDLMRVVVVPVLPLSFLLAGETHKKDWMSPSKIFH
jgi:hypothetical protein